MDVAIIGAGLSGLTCAHELLRQGIKPTVFESKKYVGEVLDLPLVILNMFNMPISQPLKYLKKDYDINIEPNFLIKKMVMHTANNNLRVNSNLGYILKRGRYEDGLESQILRNANIPIKFDSYIDLNTIKDDFDYIVVATGTPDIAKDLSIFTSKFECNARIAKVLGDFDVNKIIAWLNKVFCKSGFAYLVPNSQKDARLVLVVNNISPNELDYYWKKFLQLVNIEYEISNIIDVTHIVGYVKPVQYKNIMLCGNAGGFLDDILGFGSIKAMISGALAAKSIVEKRNYNKITQKLFEDIKQMDKFRKALNTFDNKRIDSLLEFVSNPVIKYYVYHNPFFKATQGVRLAQIYSLFKGKN